MSKGNKVVSAGAVALALVLAFTVGVGAVTVSGGVAGQDNLAPEPPLGVGGSDLLQATLVGGGAELEWMASPSDMVRPSPTGLDFTSGGTFADVNDVAAYVVSRSDNGGAFFEIAQVVGETAYTDITPVAGSVQYKVAAADAAGNMSEALLSLILSEGAAPDLTISPSTDIDFGVVGTAATASETITVTNAATETGAIGSVVATVEGDGFSVDVASLAVDPSGSGEIVVSFSGPDVDGFNGTYAGTLTLRTNDADIQELVLALSAEITDGPSAADILVPADLTFGQRIIDSAYDETLTITNQGDLDLEVTSIVVDGEGFAVTPALATIAGGGTADVTVTFSPTVVQLYTGTITITSDDPDEEIVEVSVSGRGIAASDIDPNEKVEKTVVKAEITLDLVIDHTDDTVVAQTKADFIAALAAFLGIDPSRITITAFTEGSVVIEFEIAEPETGVVEPTAEEALVALVAAVDDPAVEPVEDVAPAQTLVDETEVLTLQILDPNGDPVVGWFTRGGSTVGFNDFFAFADRFGASDGEPLYDPLYDIDPELADGVIGFGDFFKFADDFGKTIANADEVRAFLGLPAE